MNAYEKIIQMLDEKGIAYEEMRHDPVITAMEASRIRNGLSLSQGAKALITTFIKKDKSEKTVLVVVPGDKKFNSKKIKIHYNLKDIRMVPSDLVERVTDGVLPGGVPPFGNIFDLDTIADNSVLNNERIAFNAGDRTITLIVKMKDWLTICNPKVLDIC